MLRSHFTPARNSRHRIAALALLRALLREGRGITVPEDVRRNGRSPVSELVKRGFHRNRTETSSRLIFAAMSAGYKFLTLFKNAQTEGSQEHDEIVTYLRDRNEMKTRADAGQPPRREHPPQRRADYKPVLEKVSGPEEPPEYRAVRYPRPRDSFQGRREVPKVVVTAQGLTFLRNPHVQQPQCVHEMLRSKGQRRTKRMEKMIEAREFGLEFAEQEDVWEERVQEMLAAAAAGRAGRGGHVDRKHTGTYVESVRETIQATKASLTAGVADETARAKALVKAVEEEERLLEEEKEEAEKVGKRIVATPGELYRARQQRRRARKTRRQAGRWKRKMQRWQRRFVGLKPAPIRIRQKRRAKLGVTETSVSR